MKYTEPQLVKVGEAWYDVYIGRNPKYGDTKWGNPFRIGIDGSRDEVVAKHETWIITQRYLMDSLPELIGKILGCHCDAKQNCHGKVLIRLLCNMKLCNINESRIHEIYNIDEMRQLLERVSRDFKRRCRGCKTDEEFASEINFLCSAYGGTDTSNLINYFGDNLESEILSIIKKQSAMES